jgi:Na+/proline symporter
MAFSWMFIALLAYLVLQIGISYVVSRFIRSQADYLLAGRSLGVFLATFSIFATWFGAETVMGSSGAIAANGLSGSRADPFGYTICLLLMGFLIVKILRDRNYITIGDFFAEQYGETK